MDSVDDTTLNVAAELERSVANGPGIRYVLWLQGCPLQCEKCMNEDFRSFVPKQLIGVEPLAERILSVTGIEGVTYTGGEPMAQAEALFRLSVILKSRGLTVLCYSGFTLDELQTDGSPDISNLLSVTDVLIDGRYQKDNRASLMWRGSANQRVHFLTNTYTDYQPLLEASFMHTELVVSEGGVLFTGTFDDKIVEQLEQAIGERFNNPAPRSSRRCAPEHPCD
jgi:anaerobic ribonucleoside-triphosphate reductase activating protein